MVLVEQSLGEIRTNRDHNEWFLWSACRCFEHWPLDSALLGQTLEVRPEICLCLNEWCTNSLQKKHTHTQNTIRRSLMRSLLFVHWTSDKWGQGCCWFLLLLCFSVCFILMGFAQTKRKFGARRNSVKFKRIPFHSLLKQKLSKHKGTPFSSKGAKDYRVIQPKHFAIEFKLIHGSDVVWQKRALYLGHREVCGIDRKSSWTKCWRTQRNSEGKLCKPVTRVRLSLSLSVDFCWMPRHNRPTTKVATCAIVRKGVRT